MSEVDFSTGPIFDIATAGDGYLACEKAFQLVRKMDPEVKVTDGLTFLMELAEHMANLGMWESATACALRAITMYPSSRKQIRILLRQLYFSFAYRLSAENLSENFLSYCKRFVELFPDQEMSILLREGECCFQAGKYDGSFAIYLRLLVLFEPKDEIFEKFKLSLEKWVEGRDEIEAQFLWAKAILGVASSKEAGIQLAKTLLEEVTFSGPILNFARFYIRALEEKSSATADYLQVQYKKWIAMDSDISDFAHHAKEAHIPRTQPDLSEFMQNFLGMVHG